MLLTNAGIRPIAWITTSPKLFGLGPQLVQQGLVTVMPIVKVDDVVGGAGECAGGPDDHAPAR